MAMGLRRMPTLFLLATMVLGVVLVSTSACGIAREDPMRPEQARDALVATVENSAALLNAVGWTWDGAPEVGNCGARPGERVNYMYGYGAPPPDSDRAADAKKIADYWQSLGMTVRIVEKPLIVVYGEGGPVRGLAFSTAPGDYYISGTSLCVPGDADEIRKQDNG